MKISYFSIALAAPACALAQSPFQNLDFESAALPAIPRGQSGGIVSTSTGIPGWQAFYGASPTDSITHNDVSLGAVNISILGPYYGSGIISGNYTINLQAGFDLLFNPRDASIRQSGYVPASTPALRLRIGQGGVNFTVALADHNLQLIPRGEGGNYTLYEADISDFAGQFAELRITSLWTAQRPLNPVTVDDIVFIPEPNALAMASLGGVLLGLSRLPRRSPNLQAVDDPLVVR